MGKSITIITSYPKKGEIHSAETVGVASYTKQLLVALKKEFPKLKIRVLAEQLGEGHKYRESGVEIERAWKRNSFVSIVRLFSRLIRVRERTIMISYEAYMFGGMWLGGFFLLFLGLLRMMGKRVVMVMHQAPSKWSGVVGVLLRGFYGLVSVIASEIVVFEGELGKRFWARKIRVIPHLIPKVKKMDKAKARTKLGWDRGGKYILYFGYIAPYKGVRWLVDNWSDESDYKLVIGGGINPNHVENNKIADYVKGVGVSALEKDIQVTGYIPEEEMGLYFAACDALVLPYEQFMSSSGPLSLAWAHGKLAIMTEELRLYMKSDDIKEVMRVSELKEEDVFFKRNKNDLLRVLGSLERNANKHAEMAKRMRASRSEEKIAKQLGKLLEMK